MTTKNNSQTAHSRTRKTIRVPRRGLYNSLEPIRLNEFPQNHRAIGIWVDEPYDHKGLKEPAVDIHIETCKYIDSMSLIATMPVKRWRAKAKALTQLLIAHIDRIMHELTEHRARLVVELTKLESPDDPIVSSGVDARKTWHVHQIHEVDFYLFAEDAQTALANAHVSIGAVTDEGTDVLCGQPVSTVATLVDFQAAELTRETTVEEA